MAKSLLTFFLFAFSFTVSAQIWKPIGSNDTNRPSNGWRRFDGFIYEEFNSSLTQHDGIPYVAVSEYGSGGPIVRRYVNSKWEIVGSEPVSRYHSEYSKLFFNKSNLYVAYSDSENGNKVTMKRLNGNIWEKVGKAGFSQGAASFINITFMNDIPYVVYSDAASSNVSVSKFNGTNWELVDGAGFAPGRVRDCTITNDGSSIYVAYAEYTDGYKAVVKKYSGSIWEQVGIGYASTEYVNYLSIALDGQNTPFIAYSHYEEVGDIMDGTYTAYDSVKVKKFDGSSWITIEKLTKKQGAKAKLTTENGSVYAVYHDEEYNFETIVKKLVNDQWEMLPYIGETPWGGQGELNLAISNGNPIVSASDANPHVFQYANNKWLHLGDRASTYYYNYETLLTSEGVPYVAYGTDKASVQKFNGASWEVVGEENFGDIGSGYGSSSIPMKFILFGTTPYIALAKENQATYYRFNDKLWEKIGGGAFNSTTSINNAYTRLAFSGTIPYICFAEPAMTSGSLRWKLSVKRFNGTAWSPVGAAAFSNPASQPAIAVNGTVPYVVYNDTNTGKGLVQRYSSSSWQFVGSAVSETGFGYYDITIKEGVPYVVYSDYYNSYIKKLSGTSWVRVGGVASDYYGQDNKFTNDNGTLYVSYTDQSTGKLMVRRFNGTEWEIFGSNNASGGFAERASLAVKNNMAFVAYYSNGVYFKGTNLTILPIKLIDFRAYADKNNIVKLNWKTTRETKKGGSYIIEKSTDGKTFKKLTELKGSSSVNYNALDYNPITGLNYYRLSYLDEAGNREELAVKKVEIGLSENTDYVYPNPIIDRVINVRSGKESGLQDVKIYDLSGSLILVKKLSLTKGSGTLQLPENIASGSYLLQVENHKGFIFLVN